MPDSSRAAKLTAGLRSAGKILRADSHADEAHACEVFATAMEAAPRVHPVDALKQCSVEMTAEQEARMREYFDEPVRIGMTIEKAREIYSNANFRAFTFRNDKEDADIVVDGRLTADQLEAHRRADAGGGDMKIRIVKASGRQVELDEVAGIEILDGGTARIVRFDQFNDRVWMRLEVRASGTSIYDTGIAWPLPSVVVG